MARYMVVPGWHRSLTLEFAAPPSVEMIEERLLNSPELNQHDRDVINRHDWEVVEAWEDD